MFWTLHRNKIIKSRLILHNNIRFFIAWYLVTLTTLILSINSSFLIPYILYDAPHHRHLPLLDGIVPALTHSPPNQTLWQHVTWILLYFPIIRNTSSKTIFNSRYWKQHVCSPLPIVHQLWIYAYQSKIQHKPIHHFKTINMLNWSRIMPELRKTIVKF